MSSARLNLSSLIIGIDFDNTIASYDELLHRHARDQGLISNGVAKNKMQVRDSIRKLPGGDVQWQRLQGLVYGPKMEEANICDGMENFLHQSKQNNIKIFIVSHKTSFARYDDTQTNLRTAAMKWMAKNHFFTPAKYGLSERDVFFESTRRQKVQRIIDLGCTHFIDDLPEIFADRAFPNDINKILYSPCHSGQDLPGIKISNSWENITEWFFGLNDFDSSPSADLSSYYSKR